MRNVTYVRVHQTMHIPGLGELGSTLPSQSKALPGLEMTEGSSGVNVSAKGVSFVIPYANCIIYTVKDQ